ncbi:PorT family protein [Pontibacter silvestris]|uniref:PorT family protein n=1 Tax=Pontibacter silvestris TaxID=2305183 RepID=A0ABW4X5D8_9BACT|nr:PorT family protein [Pontibacter silvestris]MCC9137035.1 PorT family protein [Pontibacter silvestris]
MSSAANDKRGPSEEEFQRRMHDAEAKPSPDLWARIDHELTVQESKHYKGRMVLYRQLAAACFVLFILAGALFTFNFNNENIIDETVASVKNATIQSPQSDALATDRKAENTTSIVSIEPDVIEKALAAQGIEVNKTASVTHASVVPEATEAAESLMAHTAFDKKHKSKFDIATVAEADNDREAVLRRASALAKSGSVGADVEDVALKAGTVFKSLQPFYQTARQAMVSVSVPYKNVAGSTKSVQSLVINPSVLDMMPKQRHELKEQGNTPSENQQKQIEALALAFNSDLQDKENKQQQESSKEKSRWSLGLAYAPSFFNQNIGVGSQSAGSIVADLSKYSLAAPALSMADVESARNMSEAQEEFEQNTDPAFSFGVEFKTGFNLFKKVKLLAGLGFTQNSSRSKSSYILEQFSVKPSTNERVALNPSTVFLPSLNNNFSSDSVNVAKTDDFEVRYRYRHLTVPVGLQYEGKISKDWYWYAAGGMSANFLIETSILASTNEVKNVSYDFEDESPFRKVQFSGNVTAGVGKKITNSVSVMVGPEYRGYLNSLLADPDKALAPQGRPYTIGLNMAVNYMLQR